MKNKNVLSLTISSLFIFFCLSVTAQTTATLSYVSGYCNKVEARVFNSPPKVYPAKRDPGYCSVTQTNNLVSNHNAEKDVFIYQLQKLVGGSYVDQGAGHSKDGVTTIYQDLQYGETYRVKILVRTGNGTPVYNPYHPCGQDGELPGPEINIFTNSLEIVQYNQFDDNDISGVLQVTGNTGGNGTTFATRRKYCQADIAGTDINYDISSSFGADHWQINLARTNMTGGWAGGTWHDYEPTTSVSVFGEGWLGKYGSGAIWPGQYTVTMLAYRDCDSAPWASHVDYFEIIASGLCRTELGDNAQDVVVYPNPNSTGVLQYYTIGEEMERLEYTIYNMSGQALEKGQAYGGAGEIDISNLNPGMYTVSFQSAQETVTKRVTVVK